MNFEELRNYCLSLPGTTEAMPFDKEASSRYSAIVCFYVGGKWFAFADIDNFEFCNMKCPPDLAEELRAKYDNVRPAWHMNKRHWNSVYIGGDVDDETMRSLLHTAYETVVKTLPRRIRETLRP